MISPWKRILVTSCALAAVLGVTAVYRMLETHGVFTKVEPGFAGTCAPVAAPVGPEDIAIDPSSHLAFISATDRLAMKSGKPSPADGIYVYDYTRAGAKPTKLAGTSAGFHPHGISLYRSPDGKLTLFAINHRGHGVSDIAIFSVSVQADKIALTETGIMNSDLLVSPNAIAAVDETHFYVVNDHTAKSDLGRWLDDNLVLPRANALYFDGMKFSAAAEGLNFPSGVAVSRDARYVYVSQSYPRRLSTFERDPLRGTLKEVSTSDIPSNLDNLRFDAEGNLWIGSHPKAYAMAAYRKDASKMPPSVVYKVTMKDGLPQGYLAVFADTGTLIGASSVAAVADGRLLIGSAFGAKILNCKR